MRWLCTFLGVGAVVKVALMTAASHAREQAWASDLVSAPNQPTAWARSTRSSLMPAQQRARDVTAPLTEASPDPRTRSDCDSQKARGI
jgi:hypothetical protein